MNAIPDDDGDQMDDSWETSFGLDPTDPSDANLDGDNDGKTNLQEFNEGTNPTVDETTQVPMMPMGLFMTLVITLIYARTSITNTFKS